MITEFSGTIVSTCTLGNFIYIFTNTGSIYKMDPHIFNIEAMLFFSEPTRAGIQAAGANVPLAVNSVTPVIPAAIDGTLSDITMSISGIGGNKGGVVDLALIDGTSKPLWIMPLEMDQTYVQVFNIPNLNIAFDQGIEFTVANTTLTGGSVSVCLYYSTRQIALATEPAAADRQRALEKAALAGFPQYASKVYPQT